MQISFSMRSNSQPITLSDLISFEAILNATLPQDYKQHMLSYNGGLVIPNEIRHINYDSADHGISDFYPIKYGFDIMENIFSDLNGIIPSGFISIGKTRGQGEIIMSLINDSSYGNIKEWYPDGFNYDLSPSFTQLLNNMVESDE